jgi:hypothetical protein
MRALPSPRYGTCVSFIRLETLGSVMLDTHVKTGGYGAKPERV